MNMNENEKKKAAYALNLCTVSVYQIVEYDDVNIMKQEYDTILNNLNLENMPKDDALLDVIKEIMDEVTNIQIDKGDLQMVEREYQHQMKNAVWAAVPSVGAIFATADPVALAFTLATQVGIGYMNYRRNKAENELGLENSRWNIQKNRMQHLNGLQKELFATAWRLADAYNFPDEYRLTERQISDYNKALMEANPYIRYNNLDAMRLSFTAYPAFWYQIGSTANSIYRSADDLEIKEVYRNRALQCFEKYGELNRFNLLRHDVLTSSWALEYLELLNMNRDNDADGARKLIQVAEKYSGNTSDVLELCAFAYLRIQDYDNATRLFHILVNKAYNVPLNTQILSGLYIKRMFGDQSEKAVEARIEYKQLKNIAEEKYILKIPTDGTDLSKWKPEWEKEESFEEFAHQHEEEKHNEKIRIEELKKKARAFYQKPVILVYNPDCEDVAEYFLGILNENRNKIDSSLPPASRCVLKEFKNKRMEFEARDTHIILIGDSDEAKLIYKKIKTTWDFDKYGMRYVSYGNKTVLLRRDLKNDEIDGFISFAKEINERHAVKIPTDVAGYQFHIAELFEGNNSDVIDIIARVLAGIIAAPLVALAGVVAGIGNGLQAIQNAVSKKDIDFLQYSIAIYKYLESENALVD